MFFHSSFSTLDLVVYCAWAGFVAAMLLMYFHKRIIGGFVRALIREKAVTPESAKTVGELRLRMNIFISLSLKDPYSSLRRVVMCAGQEPDPSKPGIKQKRLKSLDGQTFYIPEDKVFSAEERYSKKGAKIPVIVIAAVATFFVAGAIIKYSPKIVELFGNSFAAFGGRDPGEKQSETAPDVNADLTPGLNENRTRNTDEKG